jgi:ribonuclease P protein component
MCDEADFSAEQSRSGTPARLPPADVDSGRPDRDPQPSRAGPQEAFGLKRLTQRKEYLAANHGKRAPMPGFVLLARDRADGDPDMRIGITVSKKVGNAVVRNRMKRRFRALARAVLPEHGLAGTDHVLIGRGSGIERDYAQLQADLAKALAKLRPR